MRSSFAAVSISVMLLIGCTDSDANLPRPSTTGSNLLGATELVGRVPEGLLILQGSDGATLGIDAEGGVQDYGRGTRYVLSKDRLRAAFVQPAGSGKFMGIGVLTAERQAMIHESQWDGNRGGMFPSFAWSQDGSKIAFAVPDAGHGNKSLVFAANEDGSDERQLPLSADDYEIKGWTTDGRVLALAVGGLPSNPQPRLLLAGDAVFDIPIPHDLTLMDAQMSPDGRRVAFESGDFHKRLEVWFLDVSDGVPRKIAEAGATSEALAKVYVSSIPLSVVPGFRRVNASLKGEPPIAWAPDSARIAYFQGDMTAGEWELRVINTVTGEDVSVAADVSWAAEWSPDGRYLATTKERRTGPGEILLFGPDGSTKELSAGAGNLAWSQSGSLIANGDGVRVIWPDSGEADEVTVPDRGDLGMGFPASNVWSPSGRFLAVTGWSNGENGTVSVYILDAQTATVTLIANNSSFRPVAWMRTTDGGR